MQLYLVTDRSWLGGKTLLSQVEACLDAGVTFLQLREKDLDERSFLEETREIGRAAKSRHLLSTTISKSRSSRMRTECMSASTIWRQRTSAR